MSRKEYSRPIKGPSTAQAQPGPSPATMQKAILLDSDVVELLQTAAVVGGHSPSEVIRRLAAGARKGWAMAR